MLLKKQDQVCGRWREYFDRLLTVEVVIMFSYLVWVWKEKMEEEEQQRKDD